jgi:hypothetical protein
MNAVRMPKGQRTLRVVIEGVGVVDIDRGLMSSEGNPRIRVDVMSDFDRFGPAPDGRHYTVENGDPGPGVVFLTGRLLPDSETELPFDMCADGCGKHVDHKVNGDPACGPS